MSAAKRATGRKSPARKGKPAKPSTSSRASTSKGKGGRKAPARKPVPQGQEAARIRAGKLFAQGKGGAAVAALLPNASADAVDRAIAGDPEYLYALEAKGRPGHYLVDANAHPNEKQVTTTIARALTWHNRTAPHQHLKRRPELMADFIPIRLAVSAAPAANSIAGNDRRVAQAAAKSAARTAAAQAAPDAAPPAGKDATAPAAA